MLKRILSITILSLMIFQIFNACSIKRMAMNQVADALTSTGTGNVFTSDNDPELIADALPFTIKMYEALMVSIPWHPALKLRTGNLYIMYANAFLQSPAEMLPDDQLDKQEFLLQRAKNLYLRGRDIILNALNEKYPGFLSKMENKKYEAALEVMKKEDVPFLYWGAAGWLGAYAIEPLDMKLGLTVPAAAAMMDKVLLLDENFEKGAIHDFYVSYYGSLPEYMGGDSQKARQHYKKAIQETKGLNTSSHISLATTVCVQEQNLEEFKTLLKRVLIVNPDDDPDNRLVHILNQRKARWFLENAGNFFIDVIEENE